MEEKNHEKSGPAFWYLEESRAYAPIRTRNSGKAIAETECMMSMERPSPIKSEGRPVSPSESPCRDSGRGVLNGTFSGTGYCFAFLPNFLKKRLSSHSVMHTETIPTNQPVSTSTG